MYKNNIILESYNKYRKDQIDAINTKNVPKHYGKLWQEKKIYK